MNTTLSLQRPSFPTTPVKAPTQKATSQSQNEASQPFETVNLSQAAQAQDTRPSKKGSIFSRLARTGLMVGLAASLALGGVSCTSMSTSCGPYGCVTTEQFDPVKTAVAVGAGAVVLDALNDAGHENYHHNHGYHQGYHQNYGNCYQNGGCYTFPNYSW